MTTPLLPADGDGCQLRFKRGSVATLRRSFLAWRAVVAVKAEKLRLHLREVAVRRGTMSLPSLNVSRNASEGSD